MIENTNITDSLVELQRYHYKLLKSQCEVVAHRTPCPYHDGALRHAECIYDRVLKGETYGDAGIVSMMARLEIVERHYTHLMLMEWAQRPIVISINKQTNKGGTL